MKTKRDLNGNITIIVPKHKRTIIITKALAKRCNLPTNKLFVEFPEIMLFLLLDRKEEIIAPYFYKNNKKKEVFFSAKIIKPKSEYKTIVIMHNLCLGKDFKGKISDELIKQIIEKFFNSRFNYLAFNK